MDIEKAMFGELVFKGAKEERHWEEKEEKVKTKAKKATYINGQHNSGSSRKKADIRKKRAQRNPKGKK